MGWGELTLYQDLSDGEMRARLVQRGVPLQRADRLIADRDDPDVQAAIAEILAH